MSTYDNEKTGALFKNDRATEQNKQPQYRGNCQIEGKEYSISSWIKKSKKGVTFMGLKFEEKDSQSSAPSSAVADDDAPF